MEHVVFYPGADGAEAFSRAADLEEAVRLVEHLRNDNGVGDVTVFALHAVPLPYPRPFPAYERARCRLAVPTSYPDAVQPSGQTTDSDLGTDSSAQAPCPPTSLPSL